MKKIKIHFSEIDACGLAYFESELSEAQRCIDACFNQKSFYVNDNGVKVPSFSRVCMVLDRIGKIAKDKETNAIEQAFFNGGYEYEVVGEPGDETQQIIEVDYCTEVSRVSHVDDFCEVFYWELMRCVTMYALEAAMKAEAPVGVAIIMNYINKEKLVLKSPPEDVEDEGADDEELAVYNATLEKAKKMLSFEPYSEIFFSYKQGIRTYEDYVKVYQPVVDAAFNTDTLRGQGSVTYPPFKRLVAMMMQLTFRFMFITSYGELDEYNYKHDFNDIFAGLNERFAALIYAIELAIAHNSIACAQIIVRWWESGDCQECLTYSAVPELDKSLVDKYHKVLMSVGLSDEKGIVFDQLYLKEIKAEIKHMQTLMRVAPYEALYIITHTVAVDPELWVLSDTYTKYENNWACGKYIAPSDSESHRLISEYLETVNSFVYQYVAPVAGLSQFSIIDVSAISDAIETKLDAVIPDAVATKIAKSELNWAAAK